MWAPPTHVGTNALEKNITLISEKSQYLKIYSWPLLNSH